MALAAVVGTLFCDLALAPVVTHNSLLPDASCCGGRGEVLIIGGGGVTARARLSFALSACGIAPGSCGWRACVSNENSVAAAAPSPAPRSVREEGGRCLRGTRQTDGRAEHPSSTPAAAFPPLKPWAMTAGGAASSERTTERGDRCPAHEGARACYPATQPQAASTVGRCGQTGAGPILGEGDGGHTGRITPFYPVAD
ncbi:MAG: hypothetical protein SGPRY_013009 [Prymnesium sp.]